MGEKSKILCVDDEENVLSSFRRQLRKKFELVTTTSAEEGLKILGSDKSIVVVVSDMRMPEMDGARFLSKAKGVLPFASRIMLTGNADQATAVQAVNEGEVFRFLNKPCEGDQLEAAINAGIEHNRLLKLEHDLLNRTLTGSIQMMFDVLSMTNPLAFAQSVRLKSVVSDLGNYLGVGNIWQLKIGTMLAQIGCLTIPEDILDKQYQGDILTDAENEMLKSRYRVAQKLIKNIPRLDRIADIIALLESRIAPEAIESEQGPQFVAAIIQAAYDYDLFLLRGMDHTVALEHMYQREHLYHARILSAFTAVKPKETKKQAVEIALQFLRPGMVMAEDLKNNSGMLLIPEGFKVNEAICEKVKNLGIQRNLAKMKFKVFEE